MSGSGKPDISVILATANRGDVLGSAVADVLAQTELSLELLVMDCGSADATETVVRGFADDRVRYFFLERAGRAAACAEGIRRSLGRRLIFMDVHAQWLPSLLATLVLALDQAGTETGVVYAGAECHDGEGDTYLRLPQSDYPQGRVSRALFAGPCIAPASMLVSATLLQPLTQSTQRFWLQNEDFLSLWLSAKTAFVAVPQRLVTLKDIEGQQARGLDPVSSMRGDALIRAMSDLPGMVPGRYGRRCLAGFYGHCAGQAASSGNSGLAMTHALRALLYTPFSIKAWGRVMKMAVGS